MDLSAILLAAGLPDAVREILKVAGEVADEIKPIVKGRHLIAAGLTPSPEFGNILRHAFQAQLNGEFLTVEGGIEFIKWMITIDN